MIEAVLVLIFSYILGSIPFGYLITKLSTKKNLLEIGWKKNSGSNVYKNVGKWQGVATFLLDASKGALAVYVPMYLGLGTEIQIACAILAVIGHNWSIFLKFSGGRGLATLVGALSVISPIYLAIILIPCIIFTIIWTASVGTLLSFLTGIILSLSVEAYSLPGIILFIALIPVLIKRLSPIIELQGKRELIENRLFFDQDTIPPLRIKRRKPL
ncbi:MAG: glycerol-3-phosphate acyltransferase [Candidatus Pacebacteria bacterium]|nr:glycerol-3-phosphate acyltransferase [Candidatus Paceibacterota bacterium]MDD2757297.1 glycerol-3-phosphate acyltransferase [Candidatus Paceibacterota bacterium]MDD3283849.1 glycerol-3-phosphate acyltransferase [Candidatus Paceibacterota bacterium]MDD3970032.1 glycerol-3-phosphate acyltransferase [Candidatus Paceibacterota bacterium]